jgi:hypothetical protein
MPTYDARDYAMAEKMAYDSASKAPLGGMVGATKAATDRSTFDDVYGALGEASALASRVMVLVDRLCGSAPGDMAKGGGTEPFGVLPTLRRVSEDTLEGIRNAQTALNRLDRELP